MKQITLLLIILVSTFSFSQITKIETQKAELIGKIGALGEVWIKCEKKGDRYTFTYQDNKFKQLKEYKSFSFVDEDNAFENLYKIIMKGFEEIPKEDIMLELPNDVIFLNYSKNFDVISLKITHAINHSPDIRHTVYITKKEVKKIFGKKKNESNGL
jgi:hypothetical protein